jgi:DNA-binding FrmR family transcriptional regulator
MFARLCQVLLWPNLKSYTCPDVPGCHPWPWRDPIANETQISDDQLLNRLKRIEGQIRGLQRMIEENRGCEEIITQVLATRSALEQVGVQLLDRQLQDCFSDGQSNLEPLRRLLRLWIRFGYGS